MWLAVLILIFLAVALSFIYGADSYETGFTTGAGILALMVTFTLYTTFTEPGVLPFVQLSEHPRQSWLLRQTGNPVSCLCADVLIPSA